MRRTLSTLKALTLTVAALFAVAIPLAVALAQPAWATEAQAEPTSPPQPSQGRPAAGQPEAANRLERLQARVRNQPEDLNAWLELGRLQLETGQFNRAKESFLEAVALDYLSADAHFGLGLAEYARANYRAALFEFTEVARLFPERFDGHFNRAVTLAQLRRSEEAVAAFEEALAQASPEAGPEERANAQLGLAGQLEALGSFEAAAAAYGAAISLSERTPELVLARSEALYRANMGLEALPALTELEAEAADYRASALIANIYLQANRTDYALSALNRARRRAAAGGRKGIEADVLLQLGLLQRSLGRSGAATRSFAEAAALTPASAGAFYNLGVSLLESGQPQRALAPLQNALATERVRGAPSGEVFLALATAYDQLGQPAEAQRAAEAAAARFESRSERRLRLDATAIVGRALYRAGNYRGALVALREVAQARPNSAQAQLWLGLAHYQGGDYTEAAAAYERAVGLEPDNIDARLNLGAAYLASERYADAESVYTLITQQNAEDAEAFYNLGWSLFSQGRGDEAQAAWGQASELGYEPAQAALSEYFE